MQINFLQLLVYCLVKPKLKIEEESFFGFGIKPAKTIKNSLDGLEIEVVSKTKYCDIR